jgi:integrase
MRRQGGWAYRADLGPDPATGRRRQTSRQGFRTKRAAEAALDEVLASVRSGTVATRSSVTLREFLEDWLTTQRQRLQPTTLAAYATTIRRICDGLGHVKLQALTPLQIEGFYADLADRGAQSGAPLSPKTIRNTHTVLRKALADAERLGLTGRNPASAARPPAPDRREYVTWSGEELREFFETIGDDRLRAAYVLIATTGMRRGEALGLWWRDVDLDARELAVVQTLTTIDYGMIFTTPKTPRSRRVIYLDEGTVGELRRHRRRQREEQLAAGPAWDGSHGLVFTDELGQPVHPDRFGRNFTRLVERLGLPKIRLHDLRHTYATLALKAGVHPKIVSERLGHATVGITLDLYSHVTPAIARDAADVVAKALFGGAP